AFSIHSAMTDLGAHFGKLGLFILKLDIDSLQLTPSQWLAANALLRGEARNTYAAACRLNH
ncbi:hypothetical protein ACVF3B_23235, partial [Vibrio antiquarius]